MIRGAQKAFQFIGPLPWCRQAADGLKDTFYGFEDAAREWVTSGRTQLYRVETGDVGPSWLIVECALDANGQKEFLVLWNYQGFGLFRLLENMILVAAKNGFPEIRFFTHHKAALRALRRFNPQAHPTKIDGETLYVINCRANLEQVNHVRS